MYLLVGALLLLSLKLPSTSVACFTPIVRFTSVLTASATTLKKKPLFPTRADHAA